MPPRIRSPPVKDKEANSPFAAVPTEAKVTASVPALIVTCAKSPEPASREERVMAPLPEPLEFKVRSVPAASVELPALNEMGVLSEVKVVKLPALKKISAEL